MAQRTLIRDEQEKTLFKNFIKQSVLRPASSEACITYILNQRKFAVEPIIDDLPSLKDIPILVIFGDDDWVQR